MSKFREFFAKHNDMPVGRWADQYEETCYTFERFCNTAADFLDTLAPITDPSLRGGPLTHHANCTATGGRLWKGQPMCSCGGQVEGDLVQCDCSCGDTCPQGKTGSAPRCWVRRRRVRA